MIAVLVKNSSGVLSRVSGLFSRRGYNIDSLTVGRTENKTVSRMTISLTCDIDMLEQVIKQLNKLEDVIRVSYLKSENSVYRELALIKVRSNSQNRSEINEIVKIFRSKIIDVSVDALTIELTGDGKKISALLKLLNEYGILEIARTGITALERGAETIQSIKSV